MTPVTPLRIAAVSSVAAFSLLAALPVCGQGVTATTVVAKVGGTSITQAEVVSQLLTYYGRAGLEMLTDRRVVDQEVALRKLEVTDAEVAARVAEIKKLGGAEMAKALKDGAVTEEGITTQARYALLSEKLLEAKWPVKDSDLVRLSVRFARTLTQQQARDIIREAKRGVSFELLAIREPALDGGANRGLAQPDPFLRIENPPMFKLAMQANLRPGQVTQQPLQSGKYWLVLKLEKVLGPETLSEAQKQELRKKILAARAPALLPNSRKRYRIVDTTPVSTLISDQKLSNDTEVRKVGEQPITRGELLAYLLETYGKAALDQLVERRFVEQLAKRHNVVVTDGEVDARVNAAKKGAEAAFKSALTAEGISEEAWKERVRYTYLAEKVVNTRKPVTPAELERLTVRYVRVASMQDAQQVIQLARSGARFEQLVQQKSLDKNGDGFIKPKLFLSIESPQVYEAVQKARLQPGQVLPQPVKVGNYFLVLKLEGRFGAELMSASERDAAVRRINAARMNALLDSWRGEVNVEYPLPLKSLITSARGGA